jgi:type IV pilus assembly protein PilA
LKDVRGLKNEAGFSLVELMVVVAIIGILASLAIPSVGKYMAKARQSEAKTQLSSLYTAEKAFYAEYTAYHSMFGAVGYSPEGKLRYMVGMPAGAGEAGPTNGYNNPPAAAPGNTLNTVAYCGVTGTVVAGVGCTILNGANNASASTYALPATATGINNNTFIAGATAIVYNSQTDGWTINNNKVLLNSTNGVQ